MSTGGETVWHRRVPDMANNVGQLENHWKISEHVDGRQDETYLIDFKSNHSWEWDSWTMHFVHKATNKTAQFTQSLYAIYPKSSKIDEAPAEHNISSSGRPGKLNASTESTKCFNLPWTAHTALSLDGVMWRWSHVFCLKVPVMRSIMSWH